MAHSGIEAEGDKEIEVGIGAADRRPHQPVTLLIGEGNDAASAFGKFGRRRRYALDPFPLDRPIEQVRECGELAVDRSWRRVLIAAPFFVFLDRKARDRIEAQRTKIGLQIEAQLSSLRCQILAVGLLKVVDIAIGRLAKA
jgi:hypothetical protein